MYVFVCYVLFLCPIVYVYLFIVHASQVNDLSIVLNIFIINIRLTAAKITNIIILHLFAIPYMSLYVYFTNPYSLIDLIFLNTIMYFFISPL